MRRIILVGVIALSGLALMSPQTQAQALTTIARPSNGTAGPARAAQSDAVVVGRVVAMEDKDVTIKDVTYRIAVVQVADALKGTKEKMVKVGFIPMANNNANPNPAPAIRPGIRFGNPQLAVGNDGLLFLNKGPDGKFFIIQNANFVSSEAANFKTEVETAKIGIKVGDNPAAALKSKEAQERLVAVTILIEKYREFRTNSKQEPIDAAESKLIMKALATADWTVQPFGVMHPWNMFNRLGVTAKDGWTPPQGVRDFKETVKAAKEWVEKNADTYVIKKNVGGQPVLRPGIQPLPPIQIQPNIKIRIQPLPAPAPPAQPGQALPVLPPQAIPVQPGRIQIQPLRLPPQQIEID